MLGQKDKILITGGAGFIGSYVVDELVSAGYGVRIMDNLCPPAHDGNLPPWTNKEAEFFHGDVTKKDDWRKALGGVRAVIHLAARMDNHYDFSAYIRTNVESIALAFECIADEKFPIEKFIAASSQSVYGESKYACSAHGEIYPPERGREMLDSGNWEQACPFCGGRVSPLPESEEDNLFPQTPYGISKFASEHLLLNLAARFGISAALLRFSIVLGSRQSIRHFYSGALRSFAVNVLNNEPIEMNEDGMQTRDFVDARDVARAHRLILENTQKQFNVFNIGSGRATRIIDLARIAAEEAGKEFNPLLQGRYRMGDARHTAMDINRIKTLSWRPFFSLRETVHAYLEWVKAFGNLSESLKNVYQKMEKDGVFKFASKND